MARCAALNFGYFLNIASWYFCKIPRQEKLSSVLLSSRIIFLLWTLSTENEQTRRAHELIFIQSFPHYSRSYRQVRRPQIPKFNAKLQNSEKLIEGKTE